MLTTRPPKPSAGRVARTVIIADRMVSFSISKNRAPCSSHVARYRKREYCARYSDQVLYFRLKTVGT